jgi:threonine dehydrogenase-like Zn-dependent dehydrogenase
MQELNFVEAGQLEWRDAADPTLEGDGQALVRPLAVATCDLDTGVIAGRFPIPGPFAFGHECVAEVVDVGDAVTSVRPGDLVSVAFQISCGDCAACRAGNSGSCTETPRLAMYGLPLGGHWGGFLSDLVRVPYADAMLVALPEGVAPATAASVSDNIVDASSNEDGLACALRSTAPDGVCTSIGIHTTPTTPIPLLEMYTKNITFITGRVHAREAMPEALALIADGRLDPEPVTGRHIAWDDDADALAEFREKLVIERGSGGA